MDIPTKIYKRLISNLVAYKSFFMPVYCTQNLAELEILAKNGIIFIPFMTNLRQHEHILVWSRTRCIASNYWAINSVQEILTIS